MFFVRLYKRTQNFITERILLAVQLQYGIDESYKLSVPDSGKPVYAHLEVSVTSSFFARSHQLKFHFKYTFFLTIIIEN